MKFLDDVPSLKHIVMYKGDKLSLGGIGGDLGGYGYMKNGEQKFAPFSDSILITLDHHTRHSPFGEDDGEPETFEIIISEANRQALVDLLTKGYGEIVIK